MLLITGGLGYIGSQTVLKLLEADIECCIIDNLSNSEKIVHKRLEKLSTRTIPCYIGDIADQQLLEEIFTENSITGVIHFAGYKSVEESCLNPFEYYQNNVNGTIKLLEVMEENRCRKIIFSSSATVYDMSNPKKNEYTEGDPCGASSNPYGTTKFVLENIIKDLTIHKKRSAVSLRYFNPIGADTSGELGENPVGNPDNLFPYIFKVLNGSLEKLTIFGSDYDTRDGTGERDYIDILDLVDGHIAARAHLEKQTPSYYDVFNLGTGGGVTVGEVVKTVEETTGESIKRIFGPRRSGDRACFYANTDKAREILGRESTTTMVNSIKNAWNFINKAL